MKNVYLIEFYNTKTETGVGFFEEKFTNKKQAIKQAKELYNCLCKEDKQNTNIIVNKLENDDYISILTIDN